MPDKKIVITSLLLVAVILVSACSAAPTAAPVAPATQAPAAPAATAAPAPTAQPAAPTAKPVTVEWWHIQTVDPGKTLWAQWAKDYMALHPNVTINITVLENDKFKTKLTSVMQSGNPPDIFQSWGAGTMQAYVAAGMTKDITPDLDANGGAWRNTFAQGALGVYSAGGKNYGVPWDMGMVGFWYNKDLFAKAGIANPPATWTEFIADVKALKAKGITPIALGEKSTWMGMHWYEYFVMRMAGKAGLEAAMSHQGKFTDPAFVQAGEKLKELVALDPYPLGYLTMDHDKSQGYFGDGKAAMLLGGQWTPTVSAAQSVSKKGVVNLGTFPFPAIEGGAGSITDTMGGGNGFAIGKNASPEAVDFVKFLTSAEHQKVLAENNLAIPVVKGGEAGLKDPNMVAVQAAFSKANWYILYFDQQLTPAMGDVINSATEGLYTGKKTPQQVAEAIEAIGLKELK
jgi:raffinose/stachyose/melibiose transport system substrate-binding protein